MMFLDKLSKREKIGASLGAAFLLAVFLDNVVIKPVNVGIKVLNAEIKTGEARLSRYLRNLSCKDEVLKEYQKYAKYVKKGGSDEEETAKILGEIETLARKSNLTLADMKPRMPRAIGFYKEYTVEIEVEGGMKSLVSFLYQLNNSTQLLRAEKVHLYPKKKDSPVIKGLILVTKILIP